jgi:hypothetical protein
MADNSLDTVAPVTSPLKPSNVALDPDLDSSGSEWEYEYDDKETEVSIGRGCREY